MHFELNEILCYINSNVLKKAQLNAFLIKMRKTGRHEMDKKNFDSDF
jgi:hypothetical protein